MKKYTIKIIIYLLISLPFFLISLCSPVSPDIKPDYTISYQVNIPHMKCDSINITMRINSWDRSDSVRLIAPPYYADNPVLIDTGDNFSDFKVYDTFFRQVPYTIDSILVGNYKSISIHFSKKACPVLISYYVKFKYKADSVIHWYMPVPGIRENTGYLQGCYIFMIPFSSTVTQNIWRDTFTLRVNYNPGSGIILYGDPQPDVTFKNPYQLMFSMSAILSSSVTASNILFEEVAGNQKFRLVNISMDTKFTSDQIEKTKRNFYTILADISPKFGIISETPFTIITGLNNTIGLEGMYSFCLMNISESKNMYMQSKNLKGGVGSCMTHEMIHSWVGVRTGEYDMAWWKEGTTNYLGHLIAKRNNIEGIDEFKETMLDTSAGSGNALSYRLSDPAIRNLLYTSTDIGNMVYRKGAQVTMLLDRRVRESTEYKTTIVDIIAEFVKKHENSAFYKDEYISYINANGNCDVSDIFKKYVDTPGPLSYSLLKETYDTLAAHKAFGDISR